VTLAKKSEQGSRQQEGGRISKLRTSRSRYARTNKRVGREIPRNQTVHDKEIEKEKKEIKKGEVFGRSENGTPRHHCLVLETVKK